ncbi:MAG: twin-arginine translocation signal domain-containing protein [Anaerolineae bacterium]
MSNKLTRRAFLYKGLAAALGAGLAACTGPQRLTDTPLDQAHGTL